jgi:hypothetical protein
MSDEQRAEAYRRFASKLEQVPQKDSRWLIGGAAWWSMGGPDQRTFHVYAERQGNERVGRRLFPAVDGTDRVCWEYSLMLEEEHLVSRQEAADSLEAAAQAVLQFQPQMMTITEGDKSAAWFCLQPTVWVAVVDGDLVRVVGTADADFLWCRESAALEPLRAVTGGSHLTGCASTLSQAMRDSISSLDRFRTISAAIASSAELIPTEDGSTGVAK